MQLLYRRIFFALLTFSSFLQPLAAADSKNLTTGFIERFALAKDREAVLTELIPGTEDYYYYHCLHLQNSGQLDKVQPILVDWYKRFEYSSRYQTILHRQHMLEFSRKPDETFEWLAGHLGSYHHERDREPDAIIAPAALDNATITWDAFLSRQIRDSSFVRRFTTAGQEKLVSMSLTPEQRRELLNSLPSPDLPGLVELVATELKSKDSPGFVNLAICGRLTLDQLELLRGSIPDLATDNSWVAAVASRLAATPDADSSHDPEAYSAALARLLTFARSLPPAQNSFKAGILYRALEESLTRGSCDAKLLREYLQLPRQQNYVLRSWIRTQQTRGIPLADLNADYRSCTRMRPVVDDEPLVRMCLEEVLRNAPDTSGFSNWLEKEYLDRVFAETKLLYGIGDPNNWASVLKPAELQTLRDRTEVNFTPDNPQLFKPYDEVTLKVALKNVGRLTRRVYDIDAAACYRQTGEPVSTSINLDGMIANYEDIIDYSSQPPLRRHVEKIGFDACLAPGTYLVELVGNGISARALITKGHLRLTETITPGGHLFTLLDPDGTPRPDASLIFDDRAWPADADATVLLPFSTGIKDGVPVAGGNLDEKRLPGRKPLVIEAGRVATLTHFNHLTEEYSLDLNVWLDREQLIAGETATVLLRPRLMINGVPTQINLLEKPVLEITTTDTGDISAVSRTPLTDIGDSAEISHSFIVPPRTRSLIFSVTGRIRNLSRNKDEDLRATAAIEANGILTAPTPGLNSQGLDTASLNLRRTDKGWILDVLGRNGEPFAARTVEMKFFHRCFVESHDRLLQSDKNGHIDLGPLLDIVTLKAKLNDGLAYNWSLQGRLNEGGLIIPEQITLGAGQSLSLPAPVAIPSDKREYVSLLEMAAAAVPLHDRLDKVSFSSNEIRIGPLEPGSYRLTLKRPPTGGDFRTVEISVTAGPQAAGYLLAPAVALPQTLPLLQVRAATLAKDALQVSLDGTTPDTRLHVLARRFNDGSELPFAGYNPFEKPANSEKLHPQRAAYTPGRFIGDEARYVFDRRYSARLVGNMLERPSLLIAPWSTAETETRTITARAEAPIPAAQPAPAAFAPDQSVARMRKGRALHAGMDDVMVSSGYDYLPRQSALLANLRPDENGQLSVPLKDLQGYAEITLLAIGESGLAWQVVPLADSKLTPRDLRLADSLKAGEARTERKSAQPVLTGESLPLDAATGGDFRVYDTLAQVFRLFQSLSQDNEFEKFSFITEWAALSAEAKLDRYHDYACHELNLFLYRKDKAFFDAVVKPLLSDKRDKTFMDHWLLGDDLSRYLVWREMACLNTAERILLAQRQTELRAPLLKALEQSIEVNRPSAEELDRWFAAAIGSGAMESDDLMEGDYFGVTSGDASRLNASREESAMPMKFDSVSIVKSPVIMRGIYGSRSTGGRGQELRQRAAEEQFYRSSDKTREWVESHYYKTRRADTGPELVKPNLFWLDVARHDFSNAKPFLSPNAAAAAGSLNERLLVLAILDLPFTAEKHKIAGSGAARSFEPASPALLFTRQITEAVSDGTAAPLMVVQTCFDPANRFDHTEEGDEVLKPVRDEFISGRPYGARVVATNPGDQPRRAVLLLQVPAGAMPLGGKRPTWSVPVSLDPYSSSVMEYYFYFPQAGKFSQFAPSISENNFVLAQAEGHSFQVVPTATIFDKESWDYISQWGSPEDVLNFLENRNIRRPEVNLERICWRLRDAGFFGRVVGILEKRQVFNPEVWRYAFMHRDRVRSAAWLRLAGSHFTRQLGPWLNSELFRVDAEELDIFEHKEYWPLVNARAHTLGESRKIANETFDAHFRTYMDYLAHKPALDDRDRLTLVICLLMQDRVAEAGRWFGEIAPQTGEMAMQSDYARAWLAFSRNEPQEAAAIARRYEGLEQKRWRNRFRAILAQAAEAAGATAAVDDPDSHDQTQQRLADKAAALTLEVSGRDITATVRNISEGELLLYPLDIELLFSRQPFLTGSAGQSVQIRPAYRASLQFTAGENDYAIELPPEFRNLNLLVEVRGGGLSERVSYTPNSLKVQTVASYGRVRVMDEEGRQVAGSYVKVYARHADGSVRFYKDGYTDLRGWFDYASLSTGDLDTAQRFSILVYDDTLGAILLEAQPPTR